jgi:predicted dehydrogenase
MKHMNETLEISVTGQGRIISRRRFITAAGAAAGAFAILQPQLLRGAAAGAKIDLGLIGCGGRGKWIADLFLKNSHYNLVAVADYFKERVDDVGGKFAVAESQRFSGLNGYKKLLGQKLDAVIIETPPFFHPGQAADAVAAGKHVYLAKPLAVDVPGCLSISDSGRRATAAKRVFLVDFQTRAHPAYQQAVKLVHENKIGALISGEATYQTGGTWGGMDKLLADNPNDPETRLRGWGADRVLSGDVITEQNIHALDVASWILNAEPIKAYGAGGRRRMPVKDGCWDYWAVVYYYPNDLILSFSSKQVGKGWDDIQCRIYGMNGTIDTHYFGEVRVHCDDAFNGGRLGNLFTEGVVNNIKTFYENITQGDFSNPTVEPSVRSNLVTILGRTAAYKKAEVTWTQMLKAREKLDFSFKGLKS